MVDEKALQKYEAHLTGSRIVVWDEKQAKQLYKEGFYGKPINVKKPKSAEDVTPPLELSLTEALYLLEKGELKVLREDGREMPVEELKKLAEESYRLFNDLYLVYKDLRDRGYVVKPGMKFGADFAVYQYGPGIDHAPFIVHVVPSSAKLDPIEIVRAGRLSHTVKKKFVIATISGDKVNYFVFSWRRM